MIDTKVVEVNREAVVAALDSFMSKYPTKSAAAEALGVNRVYLWRLIDGSKPMSEAILEKLGFSVEVVKTKTYIKKES